MYQDFLTPANVETLVNLLLRSQQLRSREALCIKIGINPKRIHFLRDSSDADFATQLIHYLHEIGDKEALCKLCCEELFPTFKRGQYASALKNLALHLNCYQILSNESPNNKTVEEAVEEQERNTNNLKILVKNKLFIVSAIFLIGLAGFLLVNLLFPNLTSLGDKPKLAPPDPNVEKNLVKNPGFEEGFAGWNQNNPNNAEHKLEVGYKSSKAACSIQQALGSMSTEWTGVHQENIEVKAGHKYKVEALLSWEKAVGVHSKVNWFSKNSPLGGEQLFAGPNGNSEGWVKGGNVVTAPKDADRATLSIWHGSEPNTPNSKLCIDDVVFEPISTTNPPSTSKGAVINRGGWWAEYYRGDSPIKLVSREIYGQILKGNKLNQNWTENAKTAPSELQGDFENLVVHSFAKRYLEPGQYRFTVIADDRIRVRVNNQEIISAWYNASFKDKPEGIFQSNGEMYDIVVYYKNDTDAAAILLNWEKIAN